MYIIPNKSPVVIFRHLSSSFYLLIRTDERTVSKNVSIDIDLADWTGTGVTETRMNVFPKW